MKQEKRTQNYQLSRSFYVIAIFVFVCMALLSFMNCIIDGFTDKRIVIILMNAWFVLFTMDIITIRFKRKHEIAFWHNWAIFSRNKGRDKIEAQDVDHQKSEQSDGVQLNVSDNAVSDMRKVG